MPRRARPLVLTLGLQLGMMCGATAAAAQVDTRSEILARQRAEKATQLQPYKPAKIEKALLFVENSRIVQKISPRNGFFIQYGYTGKPVGSGNAVGAGWRHDLFDGNARIVFEGGQSFRGYRMTRADLSMPRLLGEKLEIGFESSYNRYSQEDFYGLGFDSDRDDRANYSFRAPELQLRAMLTPVSWLNAGVRGGWTSVKVGAGTDDRFPSIEEEFNPPSIPGLTEQPDFSYADIFATLDTRDQPGNARAGSYIGALWRRYNDREFDLYSFDQVNLDAQQFLPIFDKKRVIALRAQLWTTAAAEGQSVPFYFQPTLGGSTSLRSASDFRYRDESVLATTIEYRWEAFSGLDMALFSDVGTVADSFGELSLGDAQTAYGVGLRFNTYKAVFFRFDVAGGGPDGVHVFIKFSKAF
jgi:outer membrane protein assembly factor BamA